MADLRARELRNDLSQVLRRVQAGEHLRVTLRGRPVARLVPVSSRSPTMPWGAFVGEVALRPADSALTTDLGHAVQGDTDDVA
jgi:prevent-host-death family protein